MKNYIYLFFIDDRLNIIWNWFFQLNISMKDTFSIEKNVERY